MLIFTSIAANYIPKARVLARSVKKHCPDVKFVVVLCDEIPQELETSLEPFDDILTVNQLGLPIRSLEAWIFSHSIVELCTAVKGAAFLKMFERYQAEKVIYLDPDVVVLDSLQLLSDLLDKNSILVTPHLTEPYESQGPLLDQEVGLLQHGIYNFGFLGVKNCAEGRRFASWWSDRLIHYCYVDLPRGIFTDQRWGDLIPAFFPDCHVIRDKTFNVATWNLLQRPVERREDGKLFIEGRPIRFYHFSGVDSGHFERALEKYGPDNGAITDLRAWYVEELKKEGQATFGKQVWAYSRYENGQPISQSQRNYFRDRPFLVDFFPNPFASEPVDQSYLDWFRRKKKFSMKAWPNRFRSLEEPGRV